MDGRKLISPVQIQWLEIGILEAGMLFTCLFWNKTNPPPD
jgi:hypothetical protein